ncbi:DUF7555 family protein [Halegenticoccus tardaugens]|uniref:DUF7555 family protein n=1 Tax=Halegenticoccus tardaugens TaxID=2071624 RepID=UPI00100A68B5|nr:hypothetical protein [Halegenticoccus tardaugens]
MNASRAGRRIADALSYVAVLTGLLFAAATAASFALGAGFVGAKHLLFYAGFALFGYSTLRLRPKPSWKRERDGAESSPREETRFQRLARVPLPESWVLPPEERVPPPAKLFVGSLAVLATSAAMEFVFGVGVPP